MYHYILAHIKQNKLKSLFTSEHFLSLYLALDTKQKRQKMMDRPPKERQLYNIIYNNIIITIITARIESGTDTPHRPKSMALIIISLWNKRI